MAGLDADRFLEDLTGRYAADYTAGIRTMLLAKATGNKIMLSAARKDLGEIIAATMGASEVLGASIVLRQAAKLRTEMAAEELGGTHFTGRLWPINRRELVAFADQPIFPRVTFEEAVQDMIDRTPATIRNAAERTAARISQLYGEGRMVAFVRSAEQAVTERVQSLISQAIKEGITEGDIGARIVKDVKFIGRETEAWTEGYARMAFRTNLNTAVTAGKFRQAQDPDIKAVMPAFRFDAVGDSDTRDNHMAGDEVIMSVDNTAWRHVSPPLGYNCRCTIHHVGLPELRRMGRIKPDGSLIEDKPPSGWFPDPGFRHGGRPDLMLNEVAK